jgi:hypothetical protein
MQIDPLFSTNDRVGAAIRTASNSTGATFDYLLETAVRESALDPRAKAPTSSARGLFQFIESTWLATVKQEGAKFGLAREAAAIERSADGSYFVRDRGARAQILKLRENPEVASLMAGALAARNAAELAPTLGREPTSGELYAAHFLGAGGARRLIALKGAHPNAPADAAFPEAARANRPIFYRADGSPRTTQEVYAVLTARHDREPQEPAPARAPMALAALQAQVQAQTQAQFQAGYTAFAAENGRAFHSLFRDGPAGPGPVSPRVHALWGELDAAAAWLDASAQAAAAGAQLAVSPPAESPAPHFLTRRK